VVRPNTTSTTILGEEDYSYGTGDSTANSSSDPTKWNYMFNGVKQSENLDNAGPGYDQYISNLASGSSTETYETSETYSNSVAQFKSVNTYNAVGVLIDTKTYQANNLNSPISEVEYGYNDNLSNAKKYDDLDNNYSLPTSITTITEENYGQPTVAFQKTVERDTYYSLGNVIEKISSSGVDTKYTYKYGESGFENEPTSIIVKSVNDSSVPTYETNLTYKSVNVNSSYSGTRDYVVLEDNYVTQDGKSALTSVKSMNREENNELLKGTVTDTVNELGTAYSNSSDVQSQETKDNAWLVPTGTANMYNIGLKTTYIGTSKVGGTLSTSGSSSIVTAYGQLLEKIDAYGDTETYTYDYRDRVTKVTDLSHDGSIHDESTMSYGEYQITNGDSESAVYDNISTDTGTGYKVDKTYNIRDELVSVSADAIGSNVLTKRTSYLYDNYGEELEQDSYGGNGVLKTTEAYSWDGSVLATEDPEGNISGTLDYDADGYLVSYQLDSTGTLKGMVKVEKMSSDKVDATYLFNATDLGEVGSILQQAYSSYGALHKGGLNQNTTTTLYATFLSQKVFSSVESIIEREISNNK